jgi:hypothetical protein
MPGVYLKGALVSLMPTFIGSIPNVIVFQYNPETITHNWTPPAAAPPPKGDKGGGDPLAVAGFPGETFSFMLAVDSNDMIADGNPITAGLATLSGVYTRLAALEMLQFPSPVYSGNLVGTVSASIGSAGANVSDLVRKTSVAYEILVWLNVEDAQWDAFLAQTPPSNGNAADEFRNFAIVNHWSKRFKSYFSICNWPRF